MTKDANDVFRECTIQLFRHMDLAEGLSACMRYLSSILPLNAMHISVVDPPPFRVRILAGVADHGAVPEEPSRAFPLPGNAAGSAGIYGRTSITVLADAGRYPLYRTVAESMGIDQPFSVLNISIALEKNQTGIVGLMARQPNPYQDVHISLLEPLVPVFTYRLQSALLLEEAAVRKKHILEDNRHLQQELRRMTGDQLLGAQSGLKAVSRMIGKAASDRKAVLLSGEAGVGKEVVAGDIHARSKRKDNPFVRVVCRRVSGNVQTGELFGYDPGAFPGAVYQRRGALDRADTGTLFLDEVGALSLDAQARLLDCLQKGRFERVGGGRFRNADVRVICATRNDLRKQAADGNFLEALRQMLNQNTIEVPPLRSRKMDIPLLANHFIHQTAVEMNLPVIPSIADGEMEYLMAYDWPGNVTELRNVIERALILGQGKLLRFRELGGFQRILHPQDRPNRPEEIPTLDEIMIRHIRQTLEKTNGRIEGKGGAADLLGIHYNTLRARMKKLGIPFGRQA